MKYIPKGGMCISCKDWKNDCSNLKFDTMPVIHKDIKLNVAIVKCLNYKKNENHIKQTV